MRELTNLVGDGGPDYISEDALDDAIASNHETIHAWLQDLAGNSLLNPSESPNMEPSASYDSLDA